MDKSLIITKYFNNMNESDRLSLLSRIINYYGLQKQRIMIVDKAVRDLDESFKDKNAIVVRSVHEKCERYSYDSELRTGCKLPDVSVLALKPEVIFYIGEITEDDIGDALKLIESGYKVVLPLSLDSEDDVYKEIKGILKTSKELSLTALQKYTQTFLNIIEIKNIEDIKLK